MLHVYNIAPQSGTVSVLIENGVTTLAPSTTAYASLNIASGAAPSSPASGDVYSTGAGNFTWYDGATAWNFCGYTNASNLTSGTLPDARLSSNVALRAGGNTFTTGSQNFAPSDTGYASINIPQTGVAPTTPIDGDIYSTGAGTLWYRDDGTDVNLLASGGFAWGGSITGTSGTGSTYTIGASASSGTRGIHITANATQVNAMNLLEINTGTSSGLAHNGVQIFVSQYSRGLGIQAGSTSIGILTYYAMGSATSATCQAFVADFVASGISARVDSAGNALIRANVRPTLTATGTYAMPIYYADHLPTISTGGATTLDDSLFRGTHNTALSSGTLTDNTRFVKLSNTGQYWKGRFIEMSSSTVTLQNGRTLSMIDLTQTHTYTGTTAETDMSTTTGVMNYSFSTTTNALGSYDLRGAYLRIRETLTQTA